MDTSSSPHDDRDELRKIIETTDILNEAERKYWLDLLPTMSPAQIKQLMEILQTEKKSLEDIEKKYDSQLQKIAQKYMSKWDSEKARATRLKRKEHEEKESGEAQKKAEEILKKW